MNRWRTTRLRSGQIIQAGLDIRRQHERVNPYTPRLGLYRGVVLQTYAPLLNDGEDNPDNYRHIRVECDVLLIRSQIRLPRVPVLQTSYGVNNAQPWVPKATTRTITGNRPLNFNVRSSRGQFVGAVPGWDDLDGDHVVVQYVEGDPDHPMITGAIPHEKTNRIIRVGTGWDEASAGAERGAPEEDELYIHHKGAELRINNDGEVLLDTVGAYTEPDTEDVTSDKGQIRVRVKDELKVTVECDGVDVLEVYKEAGGQVRIDLGEGAAQRLVLGDDQDSAVSTYVDAIKAWAILVKTGIVAGGGSLDNTIFDTASDQYKTDNAAALSSLAKTKKT